MKSKKKCTARTEVYSRVTGFYRPVQQWNKGKRSEYNDRKPFKTGRGRFKSGPKV